MVDGFSFNATKDTIYEIRFLAGGRIDKLLSLTLNKMLEPVKKLTEKTDLIEK